MLSTALFFPVVRFSDSVSLAPEFPKEKGDDLSTIQGMLKGNNPLTWVFTGDSITQGASHTHGYRSYPEIFSERVRWEMRRLRDIVINTAISGNTTADILNDFEWRIERFKPSIVSLMIGTNDCANRKVSLNSFKSNLNQLLNNIVDIGAIPILHTPNIIDKEKAVDRSSLSEYVAVIQNVSLERKIVLIDHWSFWNKIQKETVVKKWLDDPIHPNGKGHGKMAHLIFKELGIFDSSQPACNINID